MFKGENEFTVCVNSSIRRLWHIYVNDWRNASRNVTMIITEAQDMSRNVVKWRVSTETLPLTHYAFLHDHMAIWRGGSPLEYRERAVYKKVFLLNALYSFRSYILPEIFCYWHIINILCHFVYLLKMWFPTWQPGPPQWVARWWSCAGKPISAK